MKAKPRRLIGWLKEIAGFDPRLKNACRLLDDAQLLRQYRRYPSATALAVLSLEETGKYWQTSSLNRDAHTADRADKSHGRKQASAASVLVGGLRVDQFEDLIGQYGYKLALKRKEEPLSPGAKTLSGFLAEVRATNLPTGNDPIVALLRGEFDPLKQACFYADQTPNGWAEPANAVDRELADKTISLARRALRLIYRERARLLRLASVDSLVD